MAPMPWFELARVPEAEVMDDSAEVEAYASAAAEEYLDRIDDTLVTHALRLGLRRGRVLDLGTGPGQIPIKIARRLPEVEIVGIDRSENMIRQARVRAAAAGLAGRVEFHTGDANRLDFPDASFDFVLCNSVLHHLERPVAVLNELARVTRPGGGVLLRDLRRPSRLVFPLHVRWYGRYYSGLMKQLYIASVRSSYTLAELGQLLHASTLRGLRPFRHGRTHIGLERPVTAANQP